MAVHTPTPPVTATRPGRPAEPLTRWSLLMLPVFFLVYLVTDVVGEYVVLPLLDLDEGSLPLMARNAGGWLSETGLFLVAVAAPVIGLVLGVKALRRGGHTAAWTAVVVNLGFALVMAYTLFDAIRMTYFPGFTFPFGG